MAVVDMETRVGMVAILSVVETWVVVVAAEVAVEEDIKTDSKGYDS